MKCSLVILAAGIGSRFGGIKQLERVGPHGEIIMDYAVRDAIRAGVERIVFLIRRAIDADFRAIIGDRIEAYCAGLGVEVAYAYQELDDLPEGFSCPPNRTRPWGTGQALLACERVVPGPFLVCNADDYYGSGSFADVVSYLRGGSGWCLSGYLLENTLSCYGGVTRGVCRVDETGRLLCVRETRQIRPTEQGIDSDCGLLDPKSCVSMNLWGFTPELFGVLREQFVSFLQENGEEVDKEFLLPEVVDTLIKAGKTSVQVLPTDEVWYGMTYREDIPIVKKALAEL
ncbi:MAG: NTP transferase domain-containing protein [Oscillospiraceae bacterium]|nr:NTP transferase domain-containing protein [Oscillospiraceae bacterium]